MCGGTPADAVATTRPRGFRPWRSTAFSLATTIAPAPSDSGDAVPAVTMPSRSNDGLSFASASVVVLGRGTSSSVSSPSLSGTGTRSAFGCSVAAAVRCCERRPHASDSSREIRSRRPTSSAVSPRLIVALPPSTSRMRGLTRRQPSVVSAISGGAP